MGEFSPVVLVKKFVIVCCPSIVFEFLVLFLVGFLNFLNDGRTFKELIFSLVLITLCKTNRFDTEYRCAPLPGMQKQRSA